ncbi:MAG: hypothetical protein ACN6O2_03680 [Stenotrophomonas sp.]
MTATFSGPAANVGTSSLHVRHFCRPSEIEPMATQQNNPQRDTQDPRTQEGQQAQQNPDQPGREKKAPQRDDEEE